LFVDANKKLFKINDTQFNSARKRHFSGLLMFSKKKSVVADKKIKK